MTTVITGPYGSFSYTIATGQWWWSDDLYRIHGFEPGDVVPTTDLLVAHKHPDDAAVATALHLRASHDRLTAAFSADRVAPTPDHPLRKDRS